MKLSDKTKARLRRIDEILDHITLVIAVLAMCVSIPTFIFWAATWSDTAFKIAVSAGVIGLIMENINPLSFEYKLLKFASRVEEWDDDDENEYLDPDDDADEYDEHDEYDDEDNDPDTTTKPGLINGKH